MIETVITKWFWKLKFENHNNPKSDAIVKIFFWLDLMLNKYVFLILRFSVF